MNLMKFLVSCTVLVVILFVSACGQVDFTAPEESTLTLTVSPTSIPANGVATLTAVGTRANGAPLPDGTSVRFVTSNIGTITPNPVETNNGVATARFRASTRSGIAEITAVSGDISSEAVEIEVGEARARTVILTASPSTLPQGGGTVDLRAFVRDEEGNAITGVQVFFDTTTGTLQSNGRPIRTDSSGVARDRLTTELDTTVTVQTNNGQTDTLDIEVGPGPGPGDLSCSFTASPVDAVIDETVFFVDTSTAGEDAFVTRSRWDFGDGDTASGQTAEHRYRTTGTFTVVHTIGDNFGNEATCSQEVTITRGEPSCTFTFAPEDPSDADVVTFDASDADDPNGFIVSYDWNFGDGSTGHDTDAIIQHQYFCTSATDRDITVSLTVTDDSGQTDSCTQSFTLDCGL
jgi:hypothetical protein